MGTTITWLPERMELDTNDVQVEPHTQLDTNDVEVEPHLQRKPKYRRKEESLKKNKLVVWAAAIDTFL